MICGSQAIVDPLGSDSLPLGEQKGFTGRPTAPQEQGELPFPSLPTRASSHQLSVQPQLSRCRQLSEKQQELSPSSAQAAPRSPRLPARSQPSSNPPTTLPRRPFDVRQHRPPRPPKLSRTRTSSPRPSTARRLLGTRRSRPGLSDARPTGFGKLCR